MRRYAYWEERPCKVCGKSIKGKRGDAKYCSANCRKAASRYGQKLLKQASQLMNDINGLQVYLQDPEHRYAAREVLYMLLGQVNHLIDVANASVTRRGAGAPVTPASVTDKGGR